MDAQKSELSPEFEGRAAPPELGAAKAAGARVTVTLDIDADVLDWLKAQPLDWQREINNLAQFYMETTISRFHHRTNPTVSPTIQRRITARPDISCPARDGPPPCCER